MKVGFVASLVIVIYSASNISKSLQIVQIVHRSHNNYHSNSLYNEHIQLQTLTFALSNAVGNGPEGRSVGSKAHQTLPEGLE